VIERDKPNELLVYVSEAVDWSFTIWEILQMLLEMDYRSNKQLKSGSGIVAPVHLLITIHMVRKYGRIYSRGWCGTESNRLLAMAAP